MNPLTMINKPSEIAALPKDIQWLPVTTITPSLLSIETGHLDFGSTHTFKNASNGSVIAVEIFIGVVNVISSHTRSDHRTLYICRRVSTDLDHDANTFIVTPIETALDSIVAARIQVHTNTKKLSVDVLSGTGDYNQPVAEMPLVTPIEIELLTSAPAIRALANCAIEYPDEWVNDFPSLNFHGVIFDVNEARNAYLAALQKAVSTFNQFELTQTK